MQAEGIVTRVEGALAYVKVQRSGSCGRCHEAGGCGGGIEASGCQEFLLDNAFGARPGQSVCLAVPDGAALKAAFLVYGLPLLAILVGAGGSFFFFESDVAAVTGGGLGFLLASLLVYGSRKAGFVQQTQPRITGILEQ
ncbi:SoxR reducing system RseC family protein [Uliginosibacterium sp. 31-16]|uniref:SoxR reducing system RseC family protein n=1 Tax=Uliginosibacterium sp. 31-16 TaxID=3068315 RepID=UPI00273E7EAF|nr:SoxR reducing system RseC family protein [Uliginosibacterium sp. 31-16]MDP5240856.1 SoxR reducing system RseC family protein [Uliginosibacterium sp. 31-16]